MAEWRWNANFNGDFAFILPSGADRVSTVAQSGGAALYRSTDGETFENGSTLFTGANCGAPNFAIAFDPVDPMRFFVGHHDIGMHLTETGGDWFFARGVPHKWVGQGKVPWKSQVSLDLHPTRRDELIASAGTSFDRTLLRTKNAGRKWTLIDTPAGGFFRVFYHPVEPDIILAGNRRSVDGGKQFKPLALPQSLADEDAQVMDYCRANPDVMYAASHSSNRIFRSDDKGASWSLFVHPRWRIAPFDSYVTFAVDPLRCDIIYTLDANGDLARFDGTHWTPVGLLDLIEPPPGYFTFVRAVLVDPNHPEVIYASMLGVGLPAIFRSTDSGATWQDISYNRFRAGVTGFNISPHSGEVFVGGCSGTWVLPPPYPNKNGIYARLIPRPSCFDGLKNGAEQAIDCGGQCARRCALQPGAKPGGAGSESASDVPSDDDQPQRASDAEPPAASEPHGRRYLPALLVSLAVVIPAFFLLRH